MGDVLDFPAKHPVHPRCPICRAELPRFDDVSAISRGAELLMLRVRCACGTRWDITRGLE